MKLKEDICVSSDDANTSIHCIPDTRIMYIADYLTAIHHGIFIVVMCATFLGMWWRYRHYKTHLRYVRFPGHVFRWIVSTVLLLCLLASVGESLLSSATLRQHISAVWRISLPSFFALTALVSSLVGTYQMERYRERRMLWLLGIYWFVSLIMEAGRLGSMFASGLADMKIARWDLSILQLFFYLILTFVEVYVILYTKVTSEACVNDTTETLFRPKETTLPSELFAWWLGWLFDQGTLTTVDELGQLPSEYGAETIGQRFKIAYEEERVRNRRTSHRYPSLWRVLLKTNGVAMVTAGAFLIGNTCLILITPFALHSLLKYEKAYIFGTTDEEVPHYVSVSEMTTNVFVLMFVIFLAMFFQGILNASYRFTAGMEAVRIISALRLAVFEKSLRLCHGLDISSGEIANHMSVDCEMFFYVARWISNVWTFPIYGTIWLCIAYKLLGFSALVGCLVFVLMIILQGIISKVGARYCREGLAYGDRRLQKTNEILHGIRLIKLYGWEEIFYRSVEQIRKKELRWNLQRNICHGLTSLIVASSPAIPTLVMFSTHTLLFGNRITADIAFPSLFLVDFMGQQTREFISSLKFLVDGFVSMKRLEKFLSAPEIVNTNRISSNLQLYKDMPPKLSNFLKRGRTDGNHERHQNGAVTIKDGTFSWDLKKTGVQPIISDINLQIPEGKLTMIVGEVASGKSSLLAAILGEMNVLKGSVKCRTSKVGYSAQKAWILNTTLRENIIFDSRFDSVRYQRTLEACALNKDIGDLPAGDLTEIGEKGINLSGGQKQRVSLARALYSQTELVLLDDTLSALDSHVAHHVFMNAILGLLRMEKRTAVLVSTDGKYQEFADKVVTIQRGVIVHEKVSPELDETLQRRIPSILTDPLAHTERQEQVKQTSTNTENKKDGVNAHVGRLIDEEEKASGSISPHVYIFYFKIMGVAFVVAVILSYIGKQALTTAADFWLAGWAEHNVTLVNDDITLHYVRGYAWLTIANVLAPGAILLCIGSTLASKRIHKAMIQNIFRLPVRFFDINPVGRILNRLSTDTYRVDMKIQFTWMNILTFTTACAVKIATIVAILPGFTVLLVPMAILIFWVQKRFITVSRELERQFSTSRSPIYADLSEMLNGTTTIRAYRHQERFCKRLRHHIDVSNTSRLYLEATQRWSLTRLDGLSSVIVFGVTLVSLVAFLLGGLSSSLTGLCVVYSIQSTSNLQSLARAVSDCELFMNAVERIMHYAKLPTESYEGKRPKNWPGCGDIMINNVSARYADDLEPVLRNITVDIKSGQKIGVCGRTGSGKSSLMLTLFRCLDVFEGQIFIDGIDISAVHLTTLRQRLSIIPQDPILFSGSIRSNLDPEGTYTDDKDIWHALELAQLKTLCQASKKGLDTEVREGGSNFSVGQRQLFCLARAILRKSTILVLDEATASIDLETDQVLQRVISAAFSGKTVITVAHRLDTILKSDKIIVISGGRLVDQGLPQDLLSQPNTEFSKLIQSASIDSKK
ncbi:putative ABC transporter C family member 15 [Patiria miniata]|uniref:Uncharacterized protein n=1 Tax=Patiria miniata TaxID=46514 RepID=A0A914BAF5_PATMI|nr:putative ABC transporter C family member 15 [Patiria miniata]